MTLNGVMAMLFALFRQLGSFWAYYVEVVEDTPIHSASEIKPEESSFQRYVTFGDIHRGSPPARALK